VKNTLAKLLLVGLCFGCIQSDITVITKLPKEMKEVSGMALAQNLDHFWMVNDSGNKPILYAVDTNGEIKEKIEIEARNKDWEDLTTDDEGNIYIGDFGNNANDRKNLRIFKIKAEDLKNRSIDPVKISFHYPDQDKFPPKKDMRFFDCESFFFLNGYLYLCTKSRVSANPGLTRLYRIPAEKGEHEAEFVGAFKTCDYGGCWVTSADINSSKNKVVLLTEEGVYLFSDFENDDFFEGTLKTFKFSNSTQKESVVFTNDSTLYIADEDSDKKGGYLYEFSIK